MSHSGRAKPWASYQIRKIAGCACAGNAGNVSPRRRFQRKPLVSDPGMHHGTCVTHVPWCMSGSLTRGDGENVPGIPGACAPAILRIWQEAHVTERELILKELFYLHYNICILLCTAFAICPQYMSNEGSISDGTDYPITLIWFVNEDKWIIQIRTWHSPYCWRVVCYDGVSNH